MNEKLNDMKANELRIGNLVYERMFPSNELRLLKITRGSQIDNSDYFEPITLTKKWLRRLGFKCSDGFYWVKNGIGISLNGNVYGLNKKVIKHVHKLQNFYFEATDEELEFKEYCQCTPDETTGWTKFDCKTPECNICGKEVKKM